MNRTREKMGAIDAFGIFHCRLENAKKSFPYLAAPH